MRAKLAACLAGLLATPLLPPVGADPAAAQEACPAYVVLGSRGSGQDHPSTGLYRGLGPQLNQLYEQLHSRLPAGSVGLWPNDYRAVPVPEGFRDVRGYFESVADGKVKLRARFDDYVRDCAATQLILAGFSQGAQVTGAVYASLTAEQRDHVFAVLLFGDPTFNGKSKASRGDFSPRRHGYLTFFGVLKKEFPDVGNGKVLSFCHSEDPACQNKLPSFREEQHLNYHTFGDAASPVPYTERAATCVAFRAGYPGHPGGPVAKITPVGSPAPGEEFDVSGAQSLDPACEPLTFAWDLDGAGYSEPTTDAVRTVSFPAGQHTVALKVRTASGEEATDTLTVDIVEPGQYTGPPETPTSVVSTPSPDGTSATLTWQPPARGPPAEAYQVATTDGYPLYAGPSTDPRSLTLSADDLPVTVVVAAHNRRGQGPPSTPVTMAATEMVPGGDLNALWRAYGDAGGHWTGGDRTASIELPDERIAWLFSDTFLGTVNPDHTRPRNSPLVHNSLVVQQPDGQLGPTLTGGTATNPTSLVEVAGSDVQYWVADGHVAGDELQVLYNTYRVTGGGALDVEMTGTSLATFSLPNLTVTNVQALPLGDTIAWGSSVLDDGEYTYVYGSEDPGDGVRFAHVARVGRGNLGGNWEFFDGTGWSDAESASARLFRGVGTAYDVMSVGDEYVLVTQDSNIVFSYAFVAYTADTPTGPFVGPTYLFDAPREYPGKPVIVYDAHIHTAFSRGGHLTISYNVNSLDANDNYADARIYRPRFVNVDWPRPVPDPATLPGPPRNLTAANGEEGLVHLAWTPPASGGGSLTYRVYQRDVTAGQENFARYELRRAETSIDLPLLKNGDRYEFQVTAQNANGEGPPSNTASLLVEFEPPPAPANLRATPTGNAEIRLDWDATSSNVLHTVYQRDVSAGEEDFSIVPFASPGDTTLIVGPLQNGDEYEFKVTARHGGGESPPSNLARATPRWPGPPTPTGLRAVSQPNGDITLSWTAPAEGVWYWVAMRDVSDDVDDELTRLPSPVVDTTFTVTANYLIQDHLYEFTVASTNQGGDSPPTEPVQARSHADRPPTPTGLTATAQPDGTIALAWDPVPNAWYMIRMRNVSTDEQDFTEIDLPATTPAWTAMYLKHNDTYEFTVASLTQGGQSPPSEPVRATARYPIPPTPTGLTATAQPDGTIALTWDSVPNAWYSVWMRDVSDEGQDFTKINLAATTNTWTAMYLTHNTTYEFKVASLTQGGESPPTAPVRATAQYPLPAAPIGLTATPGDSEVALAWTASTTPNVYYWVYYRNVSAGEEEFTQSVYPRLETSATLGWLANGDTYEFKVTAIGQGGESPPSNLVQARPLPPLPGPPTGLIALPGTDGSITLSWTPPGPDLWYWIWLRDVTDQQPLEKRILVTTGTTFKVTGLANDHAYAFQVGATNVAGEGPLSNTAQATAHYNPPDAPTNLRGTSSGSGEITLDWDAPGPNLYYWVYVRDVEDEEFTRSVYPTDKTSATWAYLADGHTYELKVSAENLGGEGPASTPIRVVARATLPEPPTNLRATPGSGEVVLNWTASVTPDVWYLVYYRDVRINQSWQQIDIPVTSGATATVGWLTNGHPYEFKVTSTNWAGDSVPSNVVTATPRWPVPAPPTNLTATPQPNFVRLQWTASSTPGAWYWVEYRNADLGHGWQRLGLPLAGNTSFDFGGLAGYTYEFRIRSNNAGGDSAPSNVAAARPLPPLAPSGLTATPGVAQVSLRWNASATPNVWYLVEYRDATIGQGWQRVQIPVTTGTSFTMGWLRGHNYEFRVRSTAVSGDSVPSNVVSAIPLPPAPPTGLTATPQPNQVYLRWNPSPTPNVWYLIEYRDADVNGNWQRLSWPVANGTSFTMTGLVGHTYQFRVRSTGISGDSVPSNVVSGKPRPPLPPSMLWATSGDRHALLTWTASPTPGAWYWIYFRVVTICQCTAWQRALYAGPVPSFDAGYLVNGEIYEFKVTATTSTGESGSTNSIFAYPMPPYPQPPRNVWSFGGTSAITTVWNPSYTPYVRYRVYGRDVTAGAGYRVYGEAGCCNFTAYHLRSGHIYTFFVRAVDDFGRESADSNVGSARPIAPRATYEEVFLGDLIHLSREGTRQFIQLADQVAAGGDACAALFQWLWLPGRVLSIACGVVGSAYRAMANAARAYYNRGNCATWHVIWPGIAWVSEDGYATANCG